MFITWILMSAWATPVDGALAALPRSPVAGHAYTALHVQPFRGGDRVRARQTVHGLPVYGATLVAVLDGAGGVRRVVGEPLARFEGGIVPTLSADEATARAASYVPGEGSLWQPRAELAVLASPDGVGRLVWRVEVSRTTPLSARAVFVDAHDGRGLRSQPTLFEARGNVYPLNPEVSEVVEVALSGLDGDGLVGSYARVSSCGDWSNRGGCQDKHEQALPDEAGDYLFEPAPLSSDDPFAEVMMYHHLDLVARWFEDLGFRHDIMSGQRVMQGLVNFEYANAFYGDGDGDGVPDVSFGQSESADFAYDADVIYHEYAHSVFGTLVYSDFSSVDEYGSEGAPAGLNEGTADLFALAITGDPLLGEYAGNGFGLGGAIRDLDVDLRCPHDIYGESHEDGKIWAALGWRLIDDPLLGADVVSEVVLGALSAMPSNPSWEDGGDALVTAADELVAAGAMTSAQRDALVAHGEETGVVGCGRVIPLEETDGATQLLYGGFAEVPMYTQFSLEAPEGTGAVELSIADIYNYSGDLVLDVYIRRGKYVRHIVEDGDFGFQSATPKNFDHVVRGLVAGDAVILDADSDPPLEPGDTYFFSVSSQAVEDDEGGGGGGGGGWGDGGGGFAYGEVTIAGQVTLLEVVATDSAEPVAEGGGEKATGGCGCTSSGGVGGAWMMLVGGLALARRRR